LTPVENRQAVVRYSEIFANFKLLLPKSLIIMNDQILDSPINGTGELKYAGFWIRVAASLIDSLILCFAVGTVVALTFVLTGNPEDAIWMIFVVYLLAIVGVVGYFVVMESSAKQGTFGKLAMGIKVGKADGERITTMNALGRTLARWLSSAIFYIGYIMVAFDAKNQGLHDKLANTYVFYSK
jgi:uncharacterized RDD family membrane protein YckC